MVLTALTQPECVRLALRRDFASRRLKTCSGSGAGFERADWGAPLGSQLWSTGQITENAGKQPAAWDADAGKDCVREPERPEPKSRDLSGTRPQVAIRKWTPAAGDRRTPIIEVARPLTQAPQHQCTECLVSTVKFAMCFPVSVGYSDPTATPECANRHAKIIAGATIPDAARQFGRAV